MRLAEVERELRIAIDYGERLGDSNLKDDTLERLTFGYPSHSFVIDRREARDLFKVVERPNDQFLALADYFRPMAEDCLNARSPLSAFLTTEHDATVENEPGEEGHVTGQQVIEAGEKISEKRNYKFSQVMERSRDRQHQPRSRSIIRSETEEPVSEAAAALRMEFS